MNKLLALLLVSHFAIHSMEESSGVPLDSTTRFQPQSLESLCISKLEDHLRKTVFPQQSALLAQALCRQFPIPKDPYHTITKERALEMLVEMTSTNISLETELVSISPESIKFKNDALRNLVPGLLEKLELELTCQILPALFKERKSMLEICECIVVEGFAHPGRQLDKALFKSAPPALYKFLDEQIKRLLKAKFEFHPRRRRDENGEYGKYDDEWCP